MTSTLLFSDVDGTLLDRHGRYAMDAAELSPYLDRLSLVLTSSRTLRELRRNQRDLGVHGPLIAENGAVVALHWDDSCHMTGAYELVDGVAWSILTLGDDATTLRAIVRDEANRLGICYVDQATLMPDVERRASVAIRPAPSATFSSLDPLASALRACGLAVSSGGDWLAVTSGPDKGHGARAFLTWLRAIGITPSVVAAAGDGDNDVSLLQAVPHRFVISRDDGTWHADLQAISGVHRVTIPGIAGWRDVIRRVAALEEVQ